MIIGNAKVITERAYIKQGWVEVVDGEIASIGRGEIAGDIDCKGAYLIPGLVDLHSCSLKGLVTPRSGVNMPLIPAHASHEVLCLKHGITSVFHTVRLSDLRVSTEINVEEIYSGEIDIANIVNSSNGPNQYLHLRCDLAWSGIIEAANYALSELKPTIISFIRCCPGIGRFYSAAIYEDYLKSKGISGALSRPVSSDIEMLERCASIIGMAKQNGLKVFCLHDPMNELDIERYSSIGVNVAEFPLTLDAVYAAKDNDVRVCMGAPNLVRDISQYGNLRAVDVWNSGGLEILASDYYIPSLLCGIFKLAQGDNGIDQGKLIESLNLGASMPSKVLGWSEFGSIDKNKKANLVVVSIKDRQPVVTLAMVSGQVRYWQP